MFLCFPTHSPQTQGGVGNQIQLVFLILFYFFYCSRFCHTLKWISHGFTCVTHPDTPSHLPLHPIPLGLPSAPGPSACLMHPSWFFNSTSPKRTEGREQVKEKRYISLNATTSKAASGKFQNLKDKCSWKLFNEWGTSCSRPKSEARTLMYHTKKVSEVFRAPITVHT